MDKLVGPMVSAIREDRYISLSREDNLSTVDKLVEPMVSAIREDRYISLSREDNLSTVDKLVGPMVSVIREDTLYFHVHIMLQVHTYVDELIISDTRRLSVKNQIQAILRNCLLLETVTPHQKV